MPKRKTSFESIGAADSAPRPQQQPRTTGGDQTECPVCFESFADAQLERFPCGHATCQLCGIRCENCPMCRTGRDGRSDAQRRRAQERFGALAGARLLVTQVPRNRIVEFMNGSGQTPFDGDTFTIHTQVGGSGMNEVIGNVIESIMRHQQQTGRPVSRGQLQQATSAALTRVPASSRSARSARSARRVDAQPPQQNNPTNFTIRDILGRPLDLEFNR